MARGANEWTMIQEWSMDPARTPDDLRAVAKAEALGKNRRYVLIRLYHRWSMLVRAETASQDWLCVWALEYEGEPSYLFQQGRK